MNPNKQQLKEQSLLYLLSQNNFIVPEIQREYVWGLNQTVISRFIDSLAEKIGAVCDQCGNPRRSTKINIGFLYTYKPSYVTYSQERFLDENLIDGQQRFTTLILLLFYSALKEDRISDFREAIRFDGESEMAFDYKVRNLTHDFLIQLFRRVNNLANLNSIFEENSAWFLSDYQKDRTVRAIIQALVIINEKFLSKKERFYDYILNNIKFYHFRTEATNQGEELYITMNARGEALSKNEENKAALMFDDSSMYAFGSKWEDWQDFFWKHRNKGNPQSNADIGFNEFLRWIQIIEMTLADTGIDTDEDEKISEGSITKEIITLIQGESVILQKQYFSIHKIEQYIEAVRYLFTDYLTDEGYKDHYHQELDRSILQRKYLHPDKKFIEQGESFELLPAILYVARLKQAQKTIDNQKIYRLLRYLSNLRKDMTVRKTINKQVINAIKLVDVLVSTDDDIAAISRLQSGQVSRTLLTPEEQFKFRIYLDSSGREELENKFWAMEDNSILNGKIAPLLQYSYSPTGERKNFDFQKSFEHFSPSGFDYQAFALLTTNFLKLTSQDEKRISNNIWASLLLTPYYEVKPYDQTHQVVVCSNADDFHLIRNALFLNKLDEIDLFPSAAEYFQHIFNGFLSGYASLEALAQETDYTKQLYTYYNALVNQSGWDYGKGKNFGVYLKPGSYSSFFDNNVRYQHYKQKWVGAEYNYFDDSKSMIKKFYQQSWFSGQAK